MNNKECTGNCTAAKLHLQTVELQATAIATLQRENAALRGHTAPAAPVAPVAGSAGDDMEFVMALNAYRYADIKGIVGRPHPLEVAFDALVAYLDSRPASAPSVDRNADALADALNTVLWLERRLPQGYGSVPHVTRTIASLRKALAAPVAQPLAASAVPEPICSRDCNVQCEYCRGMAVPDGFVIVPDYRGYANLGTGQYVLNHSCKGEPVELVISVATEAEKSGRTVGDERANPPDALLQSEAMAVRIRFSSLVGLDALEGQLRKLRAEHFANAPRQEAQPAVQAVTDAARIEAIYQMSMVEPFIAPIASKEQWLASLDRRLAAPSHQPAASEVTK